LPTVARNLSSAGSVGLDDGEHRSGSVIARGRFELRQRPFESSKENLVVSALTFVQACRAFVVRHP